MLNETCQYNVSDAQVGVNLLLWPLSLLLVVTLWVFKTNFLYTFAQSKILFLETATHVSDVAKGLLSIDVLYIQNCIYRRWMWQSLYEYHVTALSEVSLRLYMICTIFKAVFYRGWMSLSEHHVTGWGKLSFRPQDHGRPESYV